MNILNESILNGIFALTGTLLGGFISYLIARNTKETKSLKLKVNLLSKQVISYWNLEKLYSQELGSLKSKSSKTILEEYREKIERMGFERPTMTEKKSKRIIN